MNKIKIVSLGGLNENGKNTYVVEIDGKIFIFDCGLKYANDTMYGIDYIIPDYSYLEKNNPTLVKAVLLLDGNKSMSDVYLMQTAVTSNNKAVKSVITKFNNDYKKVHTEINTEIVETTAKELDARIWEEYKVPVITAVEPFGSKYTMYKGSDCDSAALGVDRDVEQFKIPYYVALLKQLDVIKY